MVDETRTSVSEVDNQKENEVNIFKISSLPTDDTLAMRLKFTNQKKIDVFHANAAYQNRRVSFDQYLD